METILLVDGDSVNLSIGKAIFSTRLRVLTARSGIQALGYLQKNDIPDLMLVENDMPGMDGITLIKQVKEQPETAGIPVILSAYLPNSNMIEEGFRAGAAEFIVKPISPLQIQKRVEILLRIRSLEQENKRLSMELEALTGKNPSSP